MHKIFADKIKSAYNIAEEILILKYKEYALYNVVLTSFNIKKFPF